MENRLENPGEIERRWFDFVSGKSMENKIKELINQLLITWIKYIKSVGVNNELRSQSKIIHSA